MTEKAETHNKEPFQHKEFVQFSDHRLALGFRTVGDVIAWEDNKYSHPQNPANTAIVTTQRGRRFALGQGVSIELPELNRATGKFGNDGQEVYGITISDMPGGLQDIIIGEGWANADPEDPITNVLLDYGGKIADPGYRGAGQVGDPNPFDSARAHLVRVADAIAHQV